MKKPPCVTSAIVVMAIFLGIALISFLNLKAFGGIWGIAISLILYPVVHLVGLLSLLLRARWARIYSIILFSLWSLGLLLFGIFHYINNKQIATLIMEVILFGFLGWLVYALISSKEAKQYFRKSRSTTS